MESSFFTDKLQEEVQELHEIFEPAMQSKDQQVIESAIKECADVANMSLMMVDMLNQRLAHDAQWEFRQYAQAVCELVKPYFEYSLKELVKN